MFLLYIIEFFFQPVISAIKNIIFMNTFKEIVRHWTTTVMKSWKSTMYRISKEEINHHNNVIYFANHRSWGDFIIDHITTEYSSLFISRMMVALVLPTVGLTGYLTNTLYFINRGSKNIKKMFDNIWNDTHNDKYHNLLVYPEGTRRGFATNACDLKKGFIYYAYDHDLNIQFIISKNKEKVFNEKKFKVSLNENIYVYYSKVIDTKHIKKELKCKNPEEHKQRFYDYINNKWKKEWDIVYCEKDHKNLIKPKKIDITKIWNNKNKISFTYRLYVAAGIIITVISVLFILTFIF